MGTSKTSYTTCDKVTKPSVHHYLLNYTYLLTYSPDSLFIILDYFVNAFSRPLVHVSPVLTTNLKMCSEVFFFIKISHFLELIVCSYHRWRPAYNDKCMAECRTRDRRPCP